MRGRMGRRRLAPRRCLSVLRIVTALLFLEHGTQKLLGFPPGSSMPAAGLRSIDAALMPASSSSSAALLIALGLFTRPAAFLAAGEMAVAYWIGHAPAGRLLPGQQCRRRGDPLSASSSSTSGIAGPGRGASTRCAAARRTDADGAGRTLDFRRISCYMISASKRMPSHPHPVINGRIAAQSELRTASFGADAGLDPAQAAISIGRFH